MAEVPDHETDHDQRKQGAQQDCVAEDIQLALNFAQFGRIQLRAVELQHDVRADVQSHPVQQRADQVQQKKARELFGQCVEKLLFD